MSFAETVNESTNHLSKTPFCYPDYGRDVKFGLFSNLFQYELYRFRGIYK